MQKRKNKKHKKVQKNNKSRSDFIIEVKNIRALAVKLYTNIEDNGIEGVKNLFSKGQTLSQEVRYDIIQEYLKKMMNN